ncbi:hypothetical protein [Oculatella sp. LEGE 06141]|uniref:hypothetical protein n=1 Tax=Oculatella sp. LEGE 06141 TaxID=1828648 RepID=UPI00403F3B4A
MVYEPDFGEPKRQEWLSEDTKVEGRDNKITQQQEQRPERPERIRGLSSGRNIGPHFFCFRSHKNEFRLDNLIIH